MGYGRNGRQTIKHAGTAYPAADMSWARLTNSQLDGHFRDLDRVVGHYAVTSRASQVTTRSQAAWSCWSGTASGELGWREN